MAKLVVGCVLIVISGATAQPVVVDCGNVRVVATENPTVPYMTGGVVGGLDADYPGDDAGLTVSKGEAGKHHYGSPDSLLITVQVSERAAPLVVKIGYLAYQYGTPACEVTWDGDVIATLDCRGAGQPGETKVAEVTLAPEQCKAGRHVLKLTENSGGNGRYAKIDAVVFEGDPELVIITPKGKPFRPRPPRRREARELDTSLPFYRERDGAPLHEVFDDRYLAKLPERWAIAGSGSGIISLKNGAVRVPTPPGEVHDLASPQRGDAGTFCLARKGEYPAAGIIRLRLRNVYTGDESVSLVSFCHPNGKDKRYFCRFRRHLALSDGKFVHNIIPVDEEFHDLRVTYAEGKAQVFCGGQLALENETWPEQLGKVCIGHAAPSKGYGIGVAVQSFFLHPTPAGHPAAIKVLREGKAVAGQALQVSIGQQDLEVTTDQNGIARVELNDDLDYPQPLVVRAAVGEQEFTGAGELFPGDVWVLNLSGKAGPAEAPAAAAVVDTGLARADWWLDLGGDGSPLARGCEAVGPGTRATGRAFGWLGECDLIAGEFPEAEHPLAADFLDAEQPGDSVGFEVAAPPGDYVISLICGSPDTGVEFEVWCEGRGVAAVREPRAGTCDLYSFPASTADGALTLRFDVGVSLCLAGMIVTPADRQAPAAQRARRAARELKTKLTVVRAMAQGIIPDPPEPEPDPELSATDKQRGFVSFPHSYMRTVYASSRPKRAELGATATGFACPGEYEPVLFSVWPLKALRRARVVAGDLKAADGATIPASAITVQRVRIWPQRFGKNTLRWTPELIEDIPEDGLELAADKTMTFWMTIEVPEAQPPGDYRGAASFSCDAGTLEVPIWLKVLPIDRASLDDLVMGMYWSFGRSAGRDLDTARTQFADMLAHGCNTLTMHEPVTVTKAEDREELDFSTLDQLLQLHKEAGFTAPVPYHGINAHIGRALYKRLVTGLVEEGRKRDWPELLFYPVDEPGRDEKRIALTAELCELIKTVPGARTYVTTNGRGVDAAALDPWLDVRCYQHLSYNPEEARKTKQASDLLWFYTGPPSSILITRMNEGIWWFRSEMTAHFYWHYCYPIGDPWYDFDGKGDYCATYPGDDGPIATIGWEGVREGLDDLRYFRTLEARIKRAREANLAQDLADKADEYLQDLCARIPADGAEVKQARAAIAPEEYVRIRWQVAKLVLALDDALAGREGTTLAEDGKFESLLLGER